MLNGGIASAAKPSSSSTRPALFAAEKTPCIIYTFRDTPSRQSYSMGTEYTVLDRVDGPKVTLILTQRVYSSADLSASQLYKDEIVNGVPIGSISSPSAKETGDADSFRGEKWLKPITYTRWYPTMLSPLLSRLALKPNSK